MPLTWGAPVPPPALSGSGSTGSHLMGVSQAIAAPQEWESIREIGQQNDVRGDWGEEKRQLKNSTQEVRTLEYG